MGELRINGNTVAVYENGTVYAGGSTWGIVLGYYGRGRIEDNYRKTVAKYNAGTAYALDSFDSVYSSGVALCRCSGTTIYEGGSSWNSTLCNFTGDVDGACAAAVLFFSLHQSHRMHTAEANAVQEGTTSDGYGIMWPLCLVLGLILALGPVVVWFALFKTGGWLSAIMIGTQIGSHIIVGAMCVDGERKSFAKMLVLMCSCATIASGLFTWLFSGTNVLMLFPSFLIAFFAAVGTSLLAAIGVVLLQKRTYKDGLRREQKITEQSKNYKPNLDVWFCKCGMKNSSDYGTCKKCGEYRNAEESKRVEKKIEAKKIKPVIVEYDATKESNTWMCICGTKNKTEYGQCKKCGTYRGSNTI